MERRRPAVSERLERSVAGRVAISVVLIAFLFVLIVQTAQRSTLRTEVMDIARPALNATGLEQGWGVFAPDPRNASFEFLARVTYADGATETWRIPHGGALFGDYWDYRWRKYLEYLVQEPWAGQTWQQFGGYVARATHRDGRRPVRVVLVRRWQTVRPGQNPPRSPVREQAYHTVRVTEELLER